MGLTLQIQLLGGFSVNYGDEPATTFGTPRLQSLLAYLALHRRTPQPRDRIAFQFWPDSAEAHARANLRGLIHRLRHSLPETDSFLTVTYQSLQWRSDAPFTLDVANFEYAVAQAASSTALQEAIVLYSGDLLPDCYDDWIFPLRQALRQTFLEALVRLIDLLEIQHDYPLAISYGQRLLRHDPLREETYRRLMHLHALNGDRASALRVYQDCQTRLQQELDVPPSALTRELCERIQAEALGNDTEVQWRKPEITAVARHNLPLQPTPLIGRQQELLEINQLLTNPNCRLLTIAGPGGIGKTRLALEAAHQMMTQFQDGVYLASLVAVDLADNLLPAVARILQLALPTHPISLEGLLNYLHRTEPEMLLVLDDLEHLLPEGVGPLQEILTHTTRLKLIVTSREALNIRWEWRFDLDELPYPVANSVEAVESYGAVQLFFQVGQRVRPRQRLSESEMQQVGQICRLVAGLPLAIELAAAQVGQFSYEAIATGLHHNLEALATTMRDVPQRQRSLHATFDTSWRSLTAEEQQVFRQLSVFRGSFTTDAAAAVAGTAQPILAKLADKSLLRLVSPERYGLHEVLRRLALEKLGELPAEEAQTLARYQNYYAAFVQATATALANGQDIPQTLARFNSELENIWAVWRWSVSHNQTQNLGVALDRIFRVSNYAPFLTSTAWNEVQRLEHQQELLAARSSEADICLLDVISVEVLAEHLLDLSPALDEAAQRHFSVLPKNNRVAGKLLAMPYNVELGLLYYRPTLLAKYGYSGPPLSWDELEMMAATIQAGERAEGQANFWGFVWQGKDYEGLTCNALEWQASHGGGRLIEPDGVITVNNPQAIAAFERAAHWVGHISPVEVTDFDEITSHSVWSAGNAAFLRFWWAYDYFQGSDPHTAPETFEVTLLPDGGGGHAATLGGEQLAISRYASFPQDALALVGQSTGRTAQLKRALEPPYYLPTIPTLYDQPELLAANPRISWLKTVLTNHAVARPSKVTGKLYPQVSRAYASAVHAIITGQVDAAAALANLEATLVEMTGFKVGLPA